MMNYRTIQALPLAAGTVVQLSEAQARDRRDRVEPLGEGRFRLKELQAFKAGEVLGIEGELPKVHQVCVEAIAPVADSAEPVAAARQMFAKREKKG
jgi:hypothetical protein